MNAINTTGRRRALRNVVRNGRTRTTSRFLTVNVQTCLRKSTVIFGCMSTLARDIAGSHLFHKNHNRQSSWINLLCDKASGQTQCVLNVLVQRYRGRHRVFWKGHKTHK